NPPAAAPTPAPPAEPAAEKPAEKVAAGTAEKAEAVRGPDRRAGKGVATVTGGLVLPPAPAGAGTVIQKAKDRLSLDAEAGKVRRVLFSGSDAGIVAVVWPS